MRTHILAFALSILLAVTARAELKWEQTTVELHPGAADKQAVAHFKYENVGKTPVRFKSVHPSCGCTTAQTQKEEVPPGSKGEITATFNIGDRTGTQIKTVSVETDDPAQALTVLTLKTMIGQPVEIKPMFVYWTSGEEPKAKTVSVKAAKDFPAKNLMVKSSNPDFQATVAPGKSAGEWKIDIQPKQTTRALATAITIQTDYPLGAPKTFYVNAQVQPAPAAPAASLQR